MQLNATLIHERIAIFMRNTLPDFTCNKSIKIAQRKSDARIDYIGWSVGRRYGDSYFVSFHSKISHRAIDHLYDKIFEISSEHDRYISKHYNQCIFHHFDFIGKFKVTNQQELDDALNRLSGYLKDDLECFFNSFKSDNDYLTYLCNKDLFFSWSEVFALKRILLCLNIDRKLLIKTHQFNLSLWEDRTDNSYSKPYLDGLKKIAKYFPDVEFVI